MSFDKPANLKVSLSLLKWKKRIELQLSQIIIFLISQAHINSGSLEYNRREVIELKFQAQKQISGQLHFARVETGLVKNGYQTAN